MLIRPLTARDTERAAQLIALTNDAIPVAELGADLEECRAKWPSIQLGAFEGDELVGVIVGRLDSADASIGWSDDTVVNAEMRGRRVGEQLLTAQLEGFRSLGCTRARGRSPRRLFDSFRFFERYGFKVIAETVSHGIWGIRDGEPLWVTEKVL